MCFFKIWALPVPRGTHVNKLKVVLRKLLSHSSIASSYQAHIKDYVSGVCNHPNRRRNERALPPICKEMLGKYGCISQQSWLSFTMCQTTATRGNHDFKNRSRYIMSCILSFPPFYSCFAANPLKTCCSECSIFGHWHYYSVFHSKNKTNLNDTYIQDPFRKLVDYSAFICSFHG